MAIAAAAVTAAALHSRLLPLLPRRRRPSLGRARCRHWDGSPPCSPCSALAPAQPPPRALAWTEPTRRAARRASAGGGGPRDDPGDAPGRQAGNAWHAGTFLDVARATAQRRYLHVFACVYFLCVYECVCFPRFGIHTPKKDLEQKSFPNRAQPFFGHNARFDGGSAPRSWTRSHNPATEYA